MNGVTERLSPDMPWWVRVIYVVGIPSAICIFLIWYVTIQMTNQITALVVNQQQIADLVRTHAVDSSYIIKETTQTRIILQQICANTATNNKERALCFQQ